MEQRDIAALKEELRRDMEALERVERLMAKAPPLQPINPSITPSATSVVMGSDSDDAEQSGVSVIGKIESIINANPSIRWTSQKVLSHLVKEGFPLRAKKPIFTVGQSLNKLLAQDRIRRVRKGAGSEPNIYSAKHPAQPQPVLDLRGQPVEDKETNPIQN